MLNRLVISNDTPLREQLATLQQQIDAQLLKCLPTESIVPMRLHDAMRYAVMAGGKRIRPILVYASAEALQMPSERANNMAMAVELLHTYSLIHDDLPAMDDDDMRRGRATCHIAFDEATAILAGDALQALAFQLMSSPVDGVNPLGLMQTQRAFAVACGSRGMAGGQAIDLGAVGQTLSLDDLIQMHNLKTGALIAFCAQGPAYLSDEYQQYLPILGHYGRQVGLAFQIRDDLLDVEGDPETTGKASGADQALDKPTFPSLIGVDQSRKMMRSLITDAISTLGQLPAPAKALHDLALYIVDRDQ